MDDGNIPQDVKDNIEFKLNLTNQHRHLLDFELVRNDTRAMQQYKVRDEVLKRDVQQGNYERIDADVFVFYIDHLSRAHFNRNFPKTIEYLTKFVNPTGEQEAELFQFFRHHSVYYNSGFNNNAMYYGEIGWIKVDHEYVLDSFTKNGYITGLFTGNCQARITYLEDRKKQKANRYDHLAGQMACDPNYDYSWNEKSKKRDPERRSPFVKGEVSIFRH